MKLQLVKYMLMAQDMARAVAFYRDTLGFVEGFVSPHWSELRFGDAILALHGGGDGSKQKTGLSLQFADVNAAYAAAIAAGAKEIRSPESREGEPIILAEIQDPEGNVIMLTQYVGET
jgi:predicted enzyme related to lactoylglutathione lyase